MKILILLQLFILVSCFKVYQYPTNQNQNNSSIKNVGATTTLPNQKFYLKQYPSNIQSPYSIRRDVEARERAIRDLEEYNPHNQYYGNKNPYVNMDNIQVKNYNQSPTNNQKQIETQTKNTEKETSNEMLEMGGS